MGYSIEEIVREFGDIVTLVEVEQPAYSKEALQEFEKRYFISTQNLLKFKEMGFESVCRELIPEYDEWLEHAGDFLDHGGLFCELLPIPEIERVFGGQPQENCYGKEAGENLSSFFNLYYLA